MIETEPLYFTEFRKHFDTRLDSIEERLNKKIEKEVGDLAIFTANEFKRIENKFDEKFEVVNERLDVIDNRLDRLESDVSEIKENIYKIEAHIGRYEIRAQNIELILLEDHKPRIVELENKVFAI